MSLIQSGQLWNGFRIGRNILVAVDDWMFSGGPLRCISRGSNVFYWSDWIEYMNVYDEMALL